MSDQRLRELERQAVQGDRKAEIELIGERARLGDTYAQACMRCLALSTFRYRGHEVYSLGAQSHRTAVFEHATTKLAFSLIPGGSFLMGSPTTELERQDSEGPQHDVSVEPFLLCQVPCTQKAWKTVMGDNPSRGKAPLRPVNTVRWGEIQAFCEMTGLRLPSEAEWEYACRGLTSGPFAFGQTVSTDQANYNGFHPYGDAPQGLYRRKATDVASFPPNAYGLYDMHGNVAEWCQDTWHDSYKGAPKVAWPPWEEPEKRQDRVNRGGHWDG